MLVGGPRRRRHGIQTAEPSGGRNRPGDLFAPSSAKVCILGLLAAEPRRPSREPQREHGQILRHTRRTGQRDRASGQRLGPAELFQVYFSLTDQGTLGSAAIKLPGVRPDEILSADAETLRSFLLDEHAVQRWPPAMWRVSCRGAVAF